MAYLSNLDDHRVGKDEDSLVGIWDWALIPSIGPLWQGQGMKLDRGHPTRFFRIKIKGVAQVSYCSYEKMTKGGHFYDTQLSGLI